MILIDITKLLYHVRHVRQCAGRKVRAGSNRGESLPALLPLLRRNRPMFASTGPPRKGRWPDRVRTAIQGLATWQDLRDARALLYHALLLPALDALGKVRL